MSVCTEFRITCNTSAFNPARRQSRLILFDISNLSSTNDLITEVIEIDCCFNGFNLKNQLII